MKRLVIALAAAAALMQPAWAVPPRFHYQARLTDSGSAPINGAATLFVGIYQGGSAGAANSGTKMYEETAAITASQGVVDHAVGSGTPTFGTALTPDMFRFSGDMFLQVAVNSAPNVVLPRQRLESVPYALVSADGETRIALPGPLPISITTPGSYVLTGNQATADATGITIDSNDVTLDLNGYTVSHATDPLVATDGVYVTYGRTNIVVRNGTFRGWQYGVNAQNCTNSRFEKLQVNSVEWFGIFVGAHCIVRDCVARDCGYGGITGKEGCSVSDCAVSNASQTYYDYGGIYLGDGCVLTNSTVMFTNGSGIFTGNACTLANCSATTCSTTYSSIWQAGISTGDTCTLRDCTAYGCALAGIQTGSGSTLVNCAAQYCFNGIYAWSGCTLKGCSSLRNYNGIGAGKSSLLDLCTASYNQSIGLFVDTDSRVIGCVANDNGGTGIRAYARCTVVGNTATRNGSTGYGSGITTDDLCKVDSNAANDNGSYGVNSGDRNVIVRNMWGGNIAGDLFLMVGTHLVGPTVNSGNIATSSNPHGNYSP